VTRIHVRLFLPDSDNPYQQLQADEARKVAAEAGIALVVDAAAGDFSLQVHQIFQATRQPHDAPNVVVVMPVQESALKSLSEATVAKGIGWIYLNRSANNVAALRQLSSKVASSVVTPDHNEIGRVHARQLRQLFPDGAQVLYVQGRFTTSSSEARAAGLREGLREGGPRIEIASTLDGNWSAKDAEATLTRWLQLMIPARLRIDAVVCQSDFMAIGALDALRATAEKLRAPSLRLLPVIGCDGLPAVGRRLVDQGDLAATVVVPTTADQAIRRVVAFYRDGLPLPEEIRLAPSGYPEGPALAERARQWASRPVLT
jgi:ABC-type sugar transport system substrate-binding protein